MFKKMKGNKDEKQIESLVQMQIEDQMNKIDDKNTMNDAINILEYGADLETRDFIGTDINDEQLAELIKPTREEVQKEMEQEELVRNAANQVNSEQEIDRNNQVHLESEAALGTIEVKKVGGEEVKSNEPLQPSAESSQLSFGEDIKTAKPKPKKPVPTAQLIQ